MLKGVNEAVIPGKISLQHWLRHYLSLTCLSLLITWANPVWGLGFIYAFLAFFQVLILFSFVSPKLEQEIDFCF